MPWASVSRAVGERCGENRVDVLRTSRLRAVLGVAAACMVSGCSCDEIGCPAPASLIVESDQGLADGEYTIRAEWDDLSYRCDVTLGEDTPAATECHPPGLTVWLVKRPSGRGLEVTFRTAPSRLRVAVSRDGAEVATYDQVMFYEDVRPSANSCESSCPVSDAVVLRVDP